MKPLDFKLITIFLVILVNTLVTCTPYSSEIDDDFDLTDSYFQLEKTSKSTHNETQSQAHKKYSRRYRHRYFRDFNNYRSRLESLNLRGRHRNHRAATARAERLWDYGVIPYEIESNFSGKCEDYECYYQI